MVGERIEDWFYRGFLADHLVRFEGLGLPDPAADDGLVTYRGWVAAFRRAGVYDVKFAIEASERLMAERVSRRRPPGAPDRAGVGKRRGPYRQGEFARRGPRRLGFLRTVRRRGPDGGLSPSAGPRRRVAGLGKSRPTAYARWVIGSNAATPRKRPTFAGAWSLSGTCWPAARTGASSRPGPPRPSLPAVATPAPGAAGT